MPKTTNRPSASQTDTEYYESWATFCRDFEETSRTNQIRVDFFLDFSKELASLGVELLPLKGLELLLRTYPTLGLRRMVDMDLLIRPKDIFSVKSFLERRGFRRLPDFEALTYALPNSILNLDIVWDIPFLPDTESIWDRAVTRIFNGRPVKCLHPEDSLFFLIAYSVIHRGAFYDDYVQDLRFFLQREGSEVDWKEWVKHVKVLHCAPPIFHGLRYAEHRGLREIPLDVLKTLEPRSLTEKTLVAFYDLMTSGKGRPRVSYLYTWLSYLGRAGKGKLLHQKFLPDRFEWELRYGKTPYLTYTLSLLLRPFWVLPKIAILCARDFFLLLFRGAGKILRQLKIPIYL